MNDEGVRRVQGPSPRVADSDDGAPTVEGTRHRPSPPPAAPEPGARPTPRALETLRAERSSDPTGAPAEATDRGEGDVVPAGAEVALTPSAESPLELGPEPLYLPLALSVGAGFKFGCGFMLAAGMAGLVLLLTFSAVFFAASLIGIPIPFGTP